MEKKDLLANYAASKQNMCITNDTISDRLFQEYGVNRGLRDVNGKGVLTGLTRISKIVSFKDENGKLINRHSITDLEFSDPTDLERMGKLGVIAEIYPQIQSIANRKDKLAMIEEKIGMDRGQYYWNRRKMADSNVLLSCGTDLPLLIDDIPESIYHAVGGYFPEGGEPFNKQNMLTIKNRTKTSWLLTRAKKE